MSQLGKLRVIALQRPFAANRATVYSPLRTQFRSSSLSAIHRGLHHSERAQYGAVRPREPTDRGSRRDAFQTRGRKPRTTHREPNDEFSSKFTARAMAGASSPRQQQKLMKKLAKKAEENDDENTRSTRRKRFIDPDASFGKQSMVYRFKHGDLKEVAKNVKIQDFVRPRSFREAKQDATRSEWQSQEKTKPGFRDESRRTENQRDRRQDFGSAPMRRQRPDRTEGFRDRPARSERPDDRGESFHERSRRPERRSDNRHEDHHDESSSGPRHKKTTMMPMTIKYTTAASQFLYGRSVVKSALEQGQRKLYNLYIYGGDNRRDSRDDTIMTRLAKKHNIPIIIVPNEEQRIMDKMSMGRPHNGFVLEASPLPKRPIKSLGKLEETVTKLGFHVELDHQTKEEEAINGTESFIKRANDTMPKPFVLLLNEILDPGNLGGILRTASYLGVDAVGITNRGSSTLTPVVLKSAAGAVEEITLFTVDDPLKFMEDSRKAGWKTFAAVPPPDRKLVRKHGEKFISTDDLQVKSPLNEHPCVLVLGNEGYGLPKQLKVAADYELSIPDFVQGSNVDSLNVSVAAGLLCHSFVKEIKTSQEDAIADSQEIIDMVAQLDNRGEGQRKVSEVVDSETIQEAEEEGGQRPDEGDYEGAQHEEAKETDTKPEQNHEEGVKGEEAAKEEKKPEESELGF